MTISGPRRPGSTSTSTSFSGKNRECLLLYLEYSHQKNLCREKSLKSDNPHKMHLVPINQNYLSRENASFFFPEPQQITEKCLERAKNYEYNSSKHDFPSLLNEFSAQLNSTSLEICQFTVSKSVCRYFSEDKLLSNTFLLSFVPHKLDLLPAQVITHTVIISFDTYMMSVSLKCRQHQGRDSHPQYLELPINTALSWLAQA